MAEHFLTRREFVRDGAVGAAAMVGAATILPAGAEADVGKIDTSKILNYNPDMEYRRCGKTGWMISSVCLGGHCSFHNYCRAGGDYCTQDSDCCNNNCNSVDGGKICQLNRFPRAQQSGERGVTAHAEDTRAAQVGTHPQPPGQE